MLLAMRISALFSPSLVLLAIGLLLRSGSLCAANAEGPAGGVVELKRFGDTEQTLGRQFFGQNDLDLKAEATYTLTFWAKSPQGLSLKIWGKLSQAPWSAVGEPQRVDVTAQWQKYEVTFEAKGAEPGHTRLSFAFADPSPGEISIADIRLRDADSPESSAANLISNGQFEAGLKKWYFEGQRPGEFQVSVQSPTEAPAAAAEPRN